MITTTGDDIVYTGDASVAYRVNPLHTGNVPFSRKPRPPLNRLWTVDLKGLISYPLVVNNVIYVTAASKPGEQDGTLLYAFDANTGSSLWGPVDLGGTY